jgi:hypothetical protein
VLHPNDLSYHRGVKRLDYHVKVEVDLPPGEDPKKLGDEIVRILRKIYGVRRAELTSIQEQTH